MMLSGSITMSDYSRNLIIASNLADEQLGFVRNIRDSNYMKLNYWSQVSPDRNFDSTDPNSLFQTGSYYVLENNYELFADFPISVTKLPDPFIEWVDKIDQYMLDNYRLCIDAEGRYQYDCSSWNDPTNFFRYMYVDEVKYDNSGTMEIISDAFRVTSKVIWAEWWYHSTEVSTIISDWKRY